MTQDTSLDLDLEVVELGVASEVTEGTQIAPGEAPFNLRDVD